MGGASLPAWVPGAWARAAWRWVPRITGTRSGFGNPGPSFVCWAPRGTGAPAQICWLPTQRRAAGLVLCWVSVDPRERWHFSKSAGSLAVFCFEWFTFFHLIPTLKISSFLFSPSCPSKTYWICRCDGTHSHTCFSWSNPSKFVLHVCFTPVPLIPKVTLNRFFCLTFVWNARSPFICKDMRV